MKFRYVKIEPKNRPDITASFVFKVYERKGRFYYKEYYSKRQNEPTWHHGTQHFSDRLDESKWHNGIITWMDNMEVFAFLL